jgi:hypothetical protein
MKMQELKFLRQISSNEMMQERMDKFEEKFYTFEKSNGEESGRIDELKCSLNGLIEKVNHILDKVKIKLIILFYLLLFCNKMFYLSY